jgi:hypothetical protein
MRDASSARFMARRVSYDTFVQGRYARMLPSGSHPAAIIRGDGDMRPVWETLQLSTALFLAILVAIMTSSVEARQGVSDYMVAAFTPDSSFLDTMPTDF